ncbi:hypothetical protein VNI00_014169 [Paramarasmius palmivorus]|uniref:Replication factor A protein 3 n=1 Tax=Paramarasmius palmivorus TaxID=297713 RepID=A0AAW0BU22_9AGAR
MDDKSPPVNSSMLPKFLGKKVRLTCKVINVNEQASRATVQASDGGDVVVQFYGDLEIKNTFIEVVGTVVDETTIKHEATINLGDELGM